MSSSTKGLVYMNKLGVMFIALFLFGCSNGTEFIQTKCEYTEKNTLTVNFSDGNAFRRVSINDDTFTFKGTTIDDMKWRSNISDLQSIQFTEKSEIKVTLKSGFSKVIGKVDSQCKSIIKTRLKKLQVGQ